MDIEVRRGGVRIDWDQDSRKADWHLTESDPQGPVHQALSVLLETNTFVVLRDEDHNSTLEYRKAVG